MKSKRIFLLLLVVLLISSIPLASVQAEEPIVKAVMFFSNNCGHCSYVKYEILPDIVDKYGDQLIIMQVNIDKEKGQELFRSVLQHFGVPNESAGVPFLVVGDAILIGSAQIPEEFPGIIEAGLENGGIDWPPAPGLAEALEPVYQAGIVGTNEPIDTSCTLNIANIPDKFQQDPIANTLAIFVLLLLIASLFFAVYAFFRKKPLFEVPVWVFPLLIVIGLIAAIYLSVIELTPTAEAYCGPVGNCNEVQRHDCATLFGIFPIGMIGVVGYFALSAAWALELTKDRQIKKIARYAFWTFSLFGVLFSIYLTFLEPFVIGATCLWCLTSAVIMLLLLVFSTAELTRLEPAVEIAPDDFSEDESPIEAPIIEEKEDDTELAE